MYSLEISILKTVAYFDVFAYPLTPDEIVFFLDRSATEEEIAGALKYLIQTKQLWQFGNFYSLRNEPAIALRRVKGNKLAETLIKRAMSVARFLSWMPYVKGIAISGSLSKNFADGNSDLDFFIITKANRLWVVRILYSIIYKLACALRIKEWFCLNYFIDELNLAIKEQNVFTAVEISTLMPLKGEAVFSNFFEANDWVFEYLPNYSPNYANMKDKAPVISKRIAEWIMNAEFGNKLDNKLLAFFKKRFDKIFAEKKLSDKGLTIGAFEVTKHACKPLPQYFQPKILARFQERFALVRNKYWEVANKEMVTWKN
jgi:hypothetical protein